MVPRVSKPGRSFKGAAAYYLHDKGAQTAERVAFTGTFNLPTQDAQRAVAHMVDTAENAAALKMAAGLRATGRKLEKPVYSYSLAWHPDQTPGRDEQIQAVQASLERLGLNDHQAVIVGHTDTQHPHVHVIVNRVHPETGKAANLGRDHVTLSKWAQSYEAERGHIYCRQRTTNNAARERGEWQKDQSPGRQEWQAWKKAENAKLWEQYRAEKAQASAAFKTQSEALWRQKEERKAAVRQQIKAAYKPEWRALFKRQKKELEEFDTSLRARLRYQARKGQGKAPVKTFLKAVFGSQDTRRQFLQDQLAERQALGERHKGAVRDAAREIGNAWRFEYDQLKAQHRQAQHTRLDTYKAQSDAIWKARPGRDQDRPASLSEKQRDAARDQKPETGRQAGTGSQKPERSSTERARDGSGGKAPQDSQKRSQQPERPADGKESLRASFAERLKGSTDDQTREQARKRARHRARRDRGRDTGRSR
jgi:hypothetical protein